MEMLDFTVLFENHTAMYIANIAIQHILILPSHFFYNHEDALIIQISTSHTWTKFLV